MAINYIQKARDLVNNFASNAGKNISSFGSRNVGKDNFGNFVNKPLGPQNRSIAQAFNATVPTVAQDFGNLYRNTLGRSGVGAVSWVGNQAGNVAQTIGQGAVDIATNAPKIVTNKGISKVSPLLKTGMGVAKIAAPGTTFFMGANAIASSSSPRPKFISPIPEAPKPDLFRRLSAGFLQGQTGINTLAPNVPAQKTNLPILGEVDVVKGVGSMAGFSKNPAWDKIFKYTSKLNVLKYTNNKVVNYITGKLFKGSIEGTIQGLAELPENATPQEKTNFVLQNIGFGSVSELAGDLFFKGAGAVREKIIPDKYLKATMKIVSNALDDVRRAILPSRNMGGKTRPLIINQLLDAWRDYNPPDVGLTTKPISLEEHNKLLSPPPTGGVEGFDALKNTDLNLEKQTLNNAVIGKGQYQVGEVYSQKIGDKSRLVQITGTNPDGTLNGWYLGGGAGVEKDFGITPASLLPGKWKPQELNTITQPNAEVNLKNYISKVFNPKPPTGGEGVRKTLPEVSPTVKTAETPLGGSSAPPQSPSTGNKKVNDFQNPSDPFYNINRIGVKNSTKEAIKNTVVSDVTAKKISEAVGGKLSFDEVKAGAEVSKELDKVFTREETVKLGREALALRNKVAQLSEINATDEQFNDALIKDKAFGQFLARLLGQRRIISDPTKKTMYNEVIGRILKTGVDPEELTKAARGVNFQDPKQLVAFYRQYIKATPGEIIDKLRYSSMLSSPNTWINNANSNFQGTGVLQPIQKTIEGGIDTIVSGLTGREKTRFAGEGPEYFKGYYGSVKTGYKRMLDSFSGKTLNENPDVRYLPTLKGGKTGQAIEAIFSVPARIQEGVDQFFKALTEGGLTKSYKYRLERGVKTGISKDAVKEANDLLFRGKLTEKGAGAVSNFVGAGAKWVRNATYSENPAFRWMAKLTFPFVNTGTNLAKAGLEGNPLTGLLNMKGNEDKIAQAAKMVMGGAVMALGASFALNDRLSFGEDTYNRDAQREAGFQPYSMKIGDKWISYSKMHPLIGFQLATVAAVADAFKKSKLSENTSGIIAQGLFDSLKFYADQTYFKNIGDFVDTVKGADVESLTRFASNYPSQFIPFRAMMGWITRIVDQYQRKPDTKADFFTKSFQQIATQIPGLSTMVPKREGPSGEPIKMSLKDRLINAVSPAKFTTENKEGKYVYEFETNALRAWKNYKVLKEKDPEAAKLYAAKMKKNRPQFYSQLKKLKSDEEMGITKNEQDIRGMGVMDRSRARAVAKELNKYALGSQERKDLVKRYKDLGIITDDVYKQLLEMKKRGEL